MPIDVPVVTRRNAFICAAALLLAPIAAQALPGYVSPWQQRYPASATSTNLDAPCQVCHQGAQGGEPWNGYGWAIRLQTQQLGQQQIEQALAAVEDLDSDGDPAGSSNLAEIEASTQPGWTVGENNSLYFKSGLVEQGASPPALLSGTFDPVQQGPDLVLSPASLEFGEVTVSTSSQLLVDIQNLGGQALDVTSVDACAGTSAEFSWILDTPLSIAPGASAGLPVTYSPVDLGPDAGCLQVTSNDPDTPVATLDVAGAGVEEPTPVSDLDIVRLRVRGVVSLDRGTPVVIRMSIRNDGTASASGDATVVGVQNGSEVYRETLPVSDDPGGFWPTLTFPQFNPSRPGVVDWTATVNDGDPDVDVVTASTRVTSRLVGTPLEDPIPAPIRKGLFTVALEPVASGLAGPLQGTVAPGLPGRLFIVDQVGIAWSLNLADGTRSIFLDVSDRLVPLGVFGPGSFDERGFLGLAFHPDYASNGLLYTYTSQPVDGPATFSTMPDGVLADHHSVVTEWTVPNPGDATSVVDPESARELMRVDQPQFNHDGGAVAFGPDGLLYIGLGDGGGADDEDGQPFIGSVVIGHGPDGNGRDGTNVLGAILRIDPQGNTSANGQYGIPLDNPFVSPADPRLPEIFAYGFRNPFRFSFDTLTGALYAADVGQNDIEEVDIVVKGGNYGWNYKEGSFFFDGNGVDSGFVVDVEPPGVPADLIDPIAEYDHDEGISITGGFVYRGSSLPRLDGRYIFGDWSRSFLGAPSGRLFYLNPRNAIREFNIEGRPDGPGLYIHGFAQDANGEVYVIGNETGTPFANADGVLTGQILKIVPPGP